MEVLVRLLDNYCGPVPPLTPAKEGDAGVDLYAAESVVIPPGERAIIRTGISMALPAGYEAQVRSKSGNAAKLGLSVLNSPGTVDAGYRGEVVVIAQNNNPPITPAILDSIVDAIVGGTSPAFLEEECDLAYSKNCIRVEEGEKIAQIVFARFERPAIRLVTELPASERGTEGLGSTGLADGSYT